MPERYIKHFPKPLLDDLVAGKWLPVVGAGLSRNASVSSGKQMPLWDDLGRQLAEELSDYPYAGALDAISAYSHEYGRPRFVERLGEALLLNEAQPGEAHRAFCSILFDIVCTTNFDFLLERQYEKTPRYCRPIIDEDQLVVNTKDASTVLLKLHGDLHHPARLVVTEEDYDGFLDKYPLLATYLANLLITRTAVFIGYSLDDPDFRQIWQVIGERLGRARRLAYAILVDAKTTDIARFARRGVKVISLPGNRAKYGTILAASFDELKEYLQTNIIKASHVTEEEPLTEFSLPKEALTRLCFFAVPLALQPYYRDQIFPITERYGFVPITAADVIAPGDNYAAKIDAIIRRSVLAVVDASTQNTLYELGMIMGMESQPQTLVITEQDSLPIDPAGNIVIQRDRRPFSEQEQFIAAVTSWFERAASTMKRSLEEEPIRLLHLREYRAAVISAMTLLETVLHDKLAENYGMPSRIASLHNLLKLAKERNLLSEADEDRIRTWIPIRNQAVHTRTPIPRSKATELVNGVMYIIVQLNKLPTPNPITLATEP
jgi:hypothetical protein